MSIKNFLILSLVFSLLSQILFSVYYSSEIINQNNNYTILTEKINTLELTHQTLQTKLASETSIDKLKQYLQEKNYQPIWRQINLNQP